MKAHRTAWGFTLVSFSAVLLMCTLPAAYGWQSGTGTHAKCLAEPPISQLRSVTVTVMKTKSTKGLASAGPKSDKPSQGMTWIPGGEFWMGSEDSMFPDARPVHQVYVDGFWMDKTSVTNAQFAAFVKAEGRQQLLETCF